MLTAVHSPGPTWPGALRAALAVVLPAGVALLAGYETQMLLITGGSFAVIYGEGHPYRSRLRIMVTAGVLLSLGQMAGASVGSLVWPQIDAGGSRWWLLFIAVFATALSAVVVFMQNALRLPPPGGFFLVMVSGGATMVARQGMNPVEVGAWALVGAATATVIGMVPALWGFHRPETAAVERLENAVAVYAADAAHTVAQSHRVESLLVSTWDMLFDAGHARGGEVTGARHTDGTGTVPGDELVRRTLAAHITLARCNPAVERDSTTSDDLSDMPNYIDLSRHTVPLARPSVRYRIYRSLHRYSGATMASVKVTVACLLAGVAGTACGFDRPDWAVLSALLVLQWNPERRSGTIRGLHRVIGSVAGVGVFALLHLLQVQDWSLLVALAVCQFFAEVFVVRNYALTVTASTSLALLMGGTVDLPLGEVVAARWSEIGLATVFSLAALWLYPRSAAIRHEGRLVDRCTGAMGALLGQLLTTPTVKDALPQRRDLQYELLSERHSAQTVALDSPAFAEGNWYRHLAVQRVGYQLLDFCTTAGDRSVSPTEVTRLAEKVRDMGGDATDTDSPGGGQGSVQQSTP
ncbi:hypothetical protein Csp1_07390 [Corynebacterium provencense]|uniref:Integral membrane bound transporter domain-containing protein n=2 Tax=Corynebacterium provencense TaxID=1737425 RepID=A0A2Z3YN48_9CORY|nr:hypothetical protein Csp1_07390 [Corynebacterium provencense]